MQQTVLVAANSTLHVNSARSKAETDTANLYHQRFQNQIWHSSRSAQSKPDLQQLRLSHRPDENAGHQTFQQVFSGVHMNKDIELWWRPTGLNSREYASRYLQGLSSVETGKSLHILVCMLGEVIAEGVMQVLEAESSTFPCQPPV